MIRKGFPRWALIGLLCVTMPGQGYAQLAEAPPASDEIALPPIGLAPRVMEIRVPNALVAETLVPGQMNISPRGGVVIGTSGNFSGTVTANRYLAGDGTAALPSYSFTSIPNTGIFNLSGNVAIAIAGSTRMQYLTGGIQFASTAGVTWSSGAVNLANDTGVTRTAAGTVAIGNGTQGNATGSLLIGDGTAPLPSLAFGSEPTLGFWRSGAATVTFQGSGLTTAGFMVAGSLYVGTSGNSVHFVRTTNGILNINNNGDTIGSQLKVDALPTVASGFGTSPSITAGSTPLAGSVNVGTGGVAVTGTITFGGTAFPSAPFCVASTLLTNSVVKVNPTTTALNFTTVTAWAASDVVSWHCISSK